MADWYFPPTPNQGAWGGYDPNYGWQTMEQIPGVLPSAAMLYTRGQGFSPYPYSTVPWFTPMQEQGWQTNLEAANQAVEAAGQNRQLMADAAFGFRNLLNRMGEQAHPDQINQIGASFDPYNNPALDEAVQRANQALSRDFYQGEYFQTGLDALGAGQYGEPAHGVARGIGLGRLADAMSRQTADMYQQGYDTGIRSYVSDRANTLQAQTEADRALLGAWSQLPSTAEMVMRTNLGYGGALGRLGDTQAQIGANYQDLMSRLMQEQRGMWEGTEAAPLRALDWYAGHVYGSPAGGSSTSTTSGGGGGSWWPGALGGAAAGLGLAQSGGFDWINNIFGGGGGGSSGGGLASSNPFGLDFGSVWGSI